MSTSSQTPDYGEPWSASDKALYHRDGPLASFMITAEMAERVVQCVNACAGMSNPAAEIQAMRDAIKEAHEALRAWPRAGSGMSTDFMAQSQAFRTGQAALAKLKPFTTP